MPIKQSIFRIINKYLKMRHTISSVLMFFGIFFIVLSVACDNSEDCEIDEQCIRNECSLVRKEIGEKCFTNRQCADCCNREYKCQDEHASTECKNDLDTTGLIVGLVICAVSFISVFIGSIIWSKKYPNNP